MHRRFFLKALSAGTALSATSSSLAILLAEGGMELGEFPFSCLSNISSARRIGECFLQSASEPSREAAHYLQLLSDDLAACPETDACSTPSDRLRSLARRDYAEERLVCIDGWYLSRTEARLCAAATLL